jgi:hypothetical protein
MKLTIKNLRQQGWKVRVLHRRHHHLKDPMNINSGIICAKGGSTEIQLTSPDGKVNVSGYAKCSVKDNFNRKLGNSIALGRAWEKANMNEYKIIDSL